VLPGLVMSAQITAHQMALQFKDWQLIVVELPGVGGSAKIAVRSTKEVAQAIYSALKIHAVTQAVVVGFDLSAVLAKTVFELMMQSKEFLGAHGHKRSCELLLLDVDKAIDWVFGSRRLPSLKLREDGAHLVALSAHFRDSLMLDPKQPNQVSHQGAALPASFELDTAVVAAAVNPPSYSKLWTLCAKALRLILNSGEETLTPYLLSSITPSQSPDQTALEAPLEAPLNAILNATLESSPSLMALHLKLRDLIKEERFKGYVHRVGGNPFVPNLEEADFVKDIDSVRYDYLQTPSGRVHVRRVGRGSKTLMMFHSAPGSAEPLELLMKQLAKGRTVVACDYLGNGDSEKAQGAVDIVSMANNAIEIAQALSLNNLDLWGTHTGALVALEFAIRQPNRVNRIILEAPPLLDASFTDDILANYLPPLQADRWGTHMLRAWNMRRDMFLFWPWYRQSRRAARSLGIPDLQTLHAWTVGLLKSGYTYHLTYAAAFKYNTHKRLPLLRCRALICAGPADMLVEGLATARQLAPEGTLVQATPATVWYPGQSPQAIKDTIKIYDTFLKGK